MLTKPLRVLKEKRGRHYSWTSQRIKKRIRNSHTHLAIRICCSSREAQSIVAWILLNISSITYSSHIRSMQLTVINFRSAYIVSNFSCRLLAVISASVVPSNWDFNLSFSMHALKCLILTRSCGTSSNAVLLARDVVLLAVLSVDIVCTVRV